MILLTLPSEADPTPRAGAAELRVLQFVTTLAFGGAERLATDISIALKERGAEVAVATDTRFARGFEDALADAKIRIEHVTLPKTQLRSIIRSTRELARIIRRYEPDVLHAHNPAAGWVATMARILARRRSLAIVTTYHGVRPDRIGLALRVLRGGEFVIAVGPSAEQQLLASISSRRVVQIKNAVSLPEHRQSSTARAEFGAGDLPLIVAVGRYVAEKDHLLLVDALAALAAGGCRFRALIVGFGPLEQELEARVRAHGLGDSVTLTGARADAVELIGTADVLAHTSLWEALPLVLLEAMSRGVPIVAVAATGVSDLVHDGVTGLLVSERSPTVIAAAFERVLADRELGKRLGEGGRAFVVENHSFERMIEEHLDVYARALALRPSG